MGILEQIEQWHVEDKHAKIEKAICALPESERGYELTCLLARALNNLDREPEALALLLSVENEGADDSLWHFRVGYAYYYLGEPEAALPYFERAAALDDGDLNAKTFVRMAKGDVAAAGTEDREKPDAQALEEAMEVVAHATLTLNARLQPMDRAWVEDNFVNGLLRDSICEGYVDGGGTLMTNEGAIESCDIEVALARDDEQFWVNTLCGGMSRFSPKGSRLILHDADGGVLKEAGIGRLEGLALYLNGTDLPGAVYEENDINHVISETIRLMGEALLYWSYYEGATETALYYYGSSFGEMYASIRAFLDEYPLCALCRIEQVA